MYRRQIKYTFLKHYLCFLTLCEVLPIKLKKMLPGTPPRSRQNSGKMLRYLLLILIVLGTCTAVLFLLNLTVASGFVYSTWARIETSEHDRKCIPYAMKHNECLIGVRHHTSDDEDYCTIEHEPNGESCRSPAYSDEGSCDNGVCVAENCVFDTNGEEEDCPDIKDIGGNSLSITMTNGICNYRYNGPEINSPCGSELALIQCSQQIGNTPLAKVLNLSPICDGTSVIGCAFTSPCGIHDTLMMARSELKDHVNRIARDPQMDLGARADEIDRLQNHAVRQRIEKLMREQK